MRPAPATGSPRCCPSASGYWAPSIRKTLITRAYLAGFPGHAGDAAGARDRLAALLPIEERVLGPEHPATLTDRHGLAGWIADAGDAAGLPIRERVSGPEHPATLAIRGNHPLLPRARSGM
jgi:hypothetical protein